MTDLFFEESAIKPWLDKRGNIKGGYAAKPGTGPAGETFAMWKHVRFFTSFWNEKGE